MANRQIKCITKSGSTNRHEAISHIGGDWGTYGERILITEAQAIRDIDNNFHSYHVKSAYGG